MGESRFKTIELSAEATLDGKETGTEVQASLYQQLTPFKQYHRGNSSWYAHKAPDGSWCREK